MVKNEFVKRSPLRILEKSTHGGLQAGGIGILAGYKGVGKTACLVHIATDQLLQDVHVIHVSFRDQTDHIITWYEDIFGELSSRYKLDGAMDLHDSIIGNRIIMNFRQDGVHWPQIQARINTLMESSSFAADTIVVDGFDISQATREEFAALSTFAVSKGLRIWLSASLQTKPSKETAGQVPAELAAFAESLSIVVTLVNMGSYVHLQLVKDHTSNTAPEMHLKLDPKILLIAEE